ncbi:MAG: DUF2384 domain-containing protein, partial [Caldilineaceae bacterium]|nr:DUF2384 domain-containing protein [Caldilineaceae bacterium]
KRRHMRHANRIQIAPSIPPQDFVQPTLTNAESALRSSIQQFALQPKFQKHIEQGLFAFFGAEETKRIQRSGEENPELSAFQEWAYFDHPFSNGERIIDRYAAEVGPLLPADQRQLLEDWQRTNRQRLLEIQAVRPGEGETVLDLLTDEVLECQDINMSHTAKRWAIVLARPVLTEGRWRFTGAGLVLDPMGKQQMVAEAQRMLETYQRAHPEATVANFYRDQALELRDLLQEIQEQVANPAVLSAEGHTLVDASARYRLKDMEAVMDALNATEEFVNAGESESTPGGEHYNWLHRGRSHIPEAESSPKHAIRHRIEWTEGPGHPSYRNLGDITVTDVALELSCLSQERLTVGKQLLEEVLGDLISHRRDVIKEFDLSREARADTSPPAPRPALPAEAAQVERELLERELETWLTTSLPFLDGQTPQEAAQTEAGRATLHEALKAMEYREDSSRMGDSPMSVRSIRQRLNLPL